jgi:hypothetical protein
MTQEAAFQLLLGDVHAAACGLQTKGAAPLRCYPAILSAGASAMEECPMNQTTFSEIITDFAMVQIDDERLQELLIENPARFFRKMSLYMINAIPRFTHPPEARIWLRFTAPTFDDTTYTVTGEEGGQATVNTEITGYSLVSAAYTMDDGYGGMMDVPVPVLANDPETGEVTLEISAEIPPDTPIMLDFYTDGLFDRELDYRVKRILGLCVQLEWEMRFVNAFLIQTPMIKDKSFDVGSEANITRANTERIRMLTDNLNDEMRKFAQDVAYVDVAGYKNSLISPKGPSAYGGTAAHD